MDEQQFRREMAARGVTDLRTVTWEAGHCNDTHRHDFGASLLMLEGEFTLTTPEGATTYRAGDTCSLAAGTPHAERAGPGGARFLVARS